MGGYGPKHTICNSQRRRPVPTTPLDTGAPARTRIHTSLSQATSFRTNGCPSPPLDGLGPPGRHRLRCHPIADASTRRRARDQASACRISSFFAPADSQGLPDQNPPALPSRSATRSLTKGSSHAALLQHPSPSPRPILFDAVTRLSSDAAPALRRRARLHILRLLLLLLASSSSIPHGLIALHPPVVGSRRRLLYRRTAHGLSLSGFPASHPAAACGDRPPPSVEWPPGSRLLGRPGSFQCSAAHRGFQPGPYQPPWGAFPSSTAPPGSLRAVPGVRRCSHRSGRAR